MSEKVEGHGGHLALAGLKPFGVTELFTLSGGHIFPLYDAARNDDVKIIDVRHEQSAVFAAEAVAKLQRRPGLAVLTAGPGVTNGVSAITSAYFNAAPVVVLGGRAPLFRWGAGSLQEIDHVPLVAPVTKHAATVTAADELTEALHAAARTALSPHRGPVFLDLPLDVVFNTGTGTVPADSTVDFVDPDPEDIFKAAALLAAAQRPVIIAGSDVYAGDATAALREAAESLQIPVFTNGMGRGSLPAGHPLAFTKARRAALKGADVVAVIGTPLDFRLNFGEFGEARVVHIVDAPSQRASHLTPAVSPAGDLRLILSTIADHRGVRADHADWVAQLREVEDAALAAQTAELEADTDPIKPGRVYGELRKILEPDAVTIGDGGDFVSYAGRYLEPSRPGTWLDPGPYGCLGTGMGYALGARATYPDRQVCVLLGDGAAGFSLMDVETLVRHKMPVVIVCGNNGIWGLEKHPMQALYGYDVAADLQPGLRYDAVVTALGGAGETVSKPAAIGPALRRAFDAGVPYLVNVLTDPADQYPRSSNLA
jgi:acetolactate synthase-1/2/3 large subunit